MRLDLASDSKYENAQIPLKMIERVKPIDATLRANESWIRAASPTIAK
ncbi:hypothetical protein VYA_33810 [Vibrio alfacsensis]|jgi:hypothetical protein|nr:hypothetical protein VYA_33810 [Vibrio alfacsensis]